MNLVWRIWEETYRAIAGLLHSIALVSSILPMRTTDEKIAVYAFTDEGEEFFALDGQSLSFLWAENQYFAVNGQALSFLP